MLRLFRASAALLLCLLLASPSLADEPITDVRVVSPAWDTFTNADGTGLYFDILRAVFTDLYGIEVRHEFVPSLRATHLVAENERDVMTCKARVDPPLTMARYPMYENAYSVFFNKENIGPWNGRQSMLGRSVVWRIGYYDSRYIPEGMETKEVKSGASALGMVVLGRMDFYLDDPTLIKESIAKSGLIFNRKEFDIQDVGFRSYHPVFNPTRRGKRLMALYDEGMALLVARGTLRPLFKKWGHPYPHFENYVEK